MILSEFNNLNFPDAPGVYFFKDIQGNILYIGRATSLKDRVRSYFNDDLIATRGPLLVDMVTQAQTVTYEETGSVLEAIILESNLIKQFQPHFNTKEKDNKSYAYVIITDEHIPRIIIARGRNLEKAEHERDILPYKVKYVFGPFPHGSLMREAMGIVRKIFPFKDEKSVQKSHDNFYQTLGLSPQINSEKDRSSYLETLRHIRLFFEGKSKVLRKELEQKMHDYAQEQNFEQAGLIRKQLFALEHIEDVALIKADSLTKNRGFNVKSIHENNESTFRIEAFDIAHTSGKEVVGAMVVMTDGELTPSQYKRFKMKRDTNNDIGNLQELLVRRFRHTEWEKPSLIVIDGGEQQFKTALDVCTKLNINIPIVSVVKDDRHVARDVLHTPDTSLNIDELRNDIYKINAEAHRFAITYHKHLRRKATLGEKVAKTLKAVKKRKLDM